MSDPRTTRPPETGDHDSVGRKAVHVLAVAGGSAGRWFTRSTRAEGADASGLASLIDLHAIQSAGDGLLTVDTEYPPMYDKIQGALHKLSDKPLRFVIDTHWHLDHASGNENFTRAGAIIIAQDNVRRILASGTVRDGVKYPATLITTGLNDPRVSSWEPAKAAAALIASGSAKPVLLRIDAEAGHGIGSTLSQRDHQIADILAFLLWRTGDPRYQPAG